MKSFTCAKSPGGHRAHPRECRVPARAREARVLAHLHTRRVLRAHAGVEGAPPGTGSEPLRPAGGPRHRERQMSGKWCELRLNELYTSVPIVPLAARSATVGDDSGPFRFVAVKSSDGGLSCHSAISWKIFSGA